MGLKVKFLGSGDAFGHGGRLMPCIMLEAGGRRMLLDCGASALISMQRFCVEPNSIGAIALSHLHGDHFGGLPYFILDAQLHSKRTEPLMVAGPAGTAQRLTQAMEVNFPGSSKIERKFQVQVHELLPGQEWQWQGFSLGCVEGVHASGAPPLAIRVQAGGKSLAYTGDTQWTDALLPALAHADLLIAEAYFFERLIKFHLSQADVASRLEALQAGRVILTHMAQDMLDRQEQTALPCARDGLELEL